MIDLPMLKIHFAPSHDNEQLIMTLIRTELPAGKMSVDCLLPYPFRLTQVPLVLRALNARQYPDYPNRERLFKQEDDRMQIITELRILDLWDGSDATGAVAADIHVRVGKKLGKTLLSTPGAQECFNSFYDTAIQAGGGEIILSFDAKAIAFAALPWEVTHDILQPILLTKGVLLSCTRVIAFAHALPSRRRLSKRLRILVIAPRVQMDSNGRTYEQLARSRMRDALHDLPVEIESLSQASMEALHNRLDQGPTVDVLDYYGHGVITEKGGALLLENDQGGRDTVLASRLAALPNLPPLIVLQACQSAQVDVEEPLAGIATALSAAGVLAVLAMQLVTPMVTATNGVTPTLYQELAAGKSIQQAIAKIRQKLYTSDSGGASWYLPVLYLRQLYDEPLVLLERSDPFLPNPFAGEGAFKDSSQHIGREADVQWIFDRLSAGGNISIIGPAGAGKSSMLALIAAKLWKQLETKPQVIWLPLRRDMKLIEAQLELTHRLGDPKAKVADLIEHLEGKHLILLLDDLGQLDKGERGLQVRLWLRQLSQDRTLATVQLVATSLRSLKDIFKGDESPDYSPLHNVMSDILEMGVYDNDEARQFISKALEGTPFQVKDFMDILANSMVPRALKDACRNRYDILRRDNPKN